MPTLPTLIERTAALSSAKAVEVDAPELGDGEKAHVRIMSIGEREAFNAALDAAREKDAAGNTLLSPDGQLKRLVPLVACEPDGRLSYSGPDDPGLLFLPAPLGERMIQRAIRAATLPSDEAKKPSGETPSSP